MKCTTIIFFLAGLLITTSCKKDAVKGCTDSKAQNFNSAATEDDGSCTYPNIPGVFDVVGNLTLAEGPHEIVVSGHYVFMCRDDAMTVADLTDPGNPTVVASFNDPTVTNTFESLTLSDDQQTLFMGCAATSSIYLLDVSNPLSPIQTGKFNTEIYPGNFLKPLALDALGNTLWAGGSNGSTGLLVKFDITGNTTLTQNSYWSDVQTGSAIESVLIGSNAVFAATANGKIRSYDLTDAAVGPLDELVTTGEAGHDPWIRGLALNGGNLYVANWGAGVLTLNVSSPTNLMVTNQIFDSEFTNQHPDAEGMDAYDVVVDPLSGKLLVANGWSGLLEIHLSDPDVVVDYVDFQYHLYENIALYGNYAILGNTSGGISGTEKGLKIIRIN